ncbi:MAG: ribonuclease P protein component [Phenylobacterium sp.]|nr:MAG: ribonuclease P protein component [Phenylobacterium sp.]
MADAAFAIERLKKRADFLACAQGPSCARGAVVVQARPRDEAPLVRAGFTATKRVGGSVVRNRAKRRMREAARLLLPDLAHPGFDYVFIARGGVTTRPWDRLLDDVKSALIRLAADRDRAPELRPAAPLPPTDN